MKIKMKIKMNNKMKEVAKEVYRRWKVKNELFINFPSFSENPEENINF